MIVEQIPGSDVDGPPSLLRRFDGETGAAEGPPLRVGRHTSFGMWATADRQRLFVTSAEDDETTMIDAELAARVAALARRRRRRGRQRRRERVRARLASRATSACSTCAPGVSGASPGATRGPSTRCAFTPDGRTLVTSGADGVLIVWDVARGEIRETLTGHAKGEVYGLHVSPDGRTLYSAGHDERAFAWDLTGDRSLVRPFDRRAAVRPRRR